MSSVKVFKHEFQPPDSCNYLGFNLLTPDFVIWQREEDSLEGSSRNIRISLNSKLVFSIDDDMWVLEVQLLGFGLGVVRQWGY